MHAQVAGVCTDQYRRRQLYVDGQRLDTRLKWTIANRIAEHEHLISRPMTYWQLLRWVRAQWPGLLPDAIGKALCDLALIGFLEVDDRGWSVRPPASRTSAARAHRNGWRPSS